jgi:hypothetical protein
MLLDTEVSLAPRVVERGGGERGGVVVAGNRYGNLPWGCGQPVSSSLVFGKFVAKGLSNFLQEI